MAKTYRFSVELKRKFGNKGLKQGNEIISANDTMHYRVRSAIAKHLRDMARDTAPNIDEPFSEDFPCEAIVRIYPPTRRRFDPPNMSPTVKPLIDGLVDANILTDDNRDIIKRHIFESRGLSGVDGCYKIDIILRHWTGDDDTDEE